MAQRQNLMKNPSPTGMPEAVRVGDLIFVKGMTGFRQGQPVAPDMDGQMRTAYGLIADALAQAGASMANVVDQTVFVTDVEAAMAVHGQIRQDVFGDNKPASATVQVTRLGLPGLMVEIKVTAHV